MPAASCCSVELPPPHGHCHLPVNPVKPVKPSKWTPFCLYQVNSIEVGHTSIFSAEAQFSGSSDSSTRVHGALNSWVATKRSLPPCINLTSAVNPGWWGQFTEENQNERWLQCNSNAFTLSLGILKVFVILWCVFADSSGKVGHFWLMKIGFCKGLSKCIILHAFNQGRASVCKRWKHRDKRMIKAGL